MIPTRIPRKPIYFLGHLERYLWACLFCHKKKVLDAGSKDGYGANLISSFAGEITLADKDEWRLQKAKDLYNFLCPTNFLLIDLEKESLTETYDVIVAFEFIEHLDNPDIFMVNAKKALKDDGVFLFSVPHMIENPEHKTLFDEEKIKLFISKYFVITEFYIQDKVVISEEKSKYPPRSYVGVAKKQ